MKIKFDMGLPEAKRTQSVPHLCKCGHPRSQHSNAREDDYMCRTCDECNGFAPAGDEPRRPPSPETFDALKDALPKPYADYVPDMPAWERR